MPAAGTMEYGIDALTPGGLMVTGEFGRRNCVGAEAARDEASARAESHRFMERPPRKVRHWAMFLTLELKSVAIEDRQSQEKNAGVPAGRYTFSSRGDRGSAGLRAFDPPTWNPK